VNSPSDHEQPPVVLDAAITFAPVGYVVVEGLRAIGPGGTPAIDAIPLDTVPELPYELLWMERGVRSVAKSTRRGPEEFLALAGEIPIKTVVDAYPLSDVRIALPVSITVRSMGQRCWSRRRMGQGVSRVPVAPVPGAIARDPHERNPASPRVLRPIAYPGNPRVGDRIEQPS